MNVTSISIRGGLITAIYEKTMCLSTSAIDESAALTLMSTDVELAAFGLEDVHEIWINPIQIGLMIWLLQKQMSWACVIPIVISAGLSTFIAWGLGAYTYCS